MHIDNDIAINSLYIMYTIYCTQIKEPILIPITLNTIKILQQISFMSIISKTLIGELVNRKAFAIGVSEGVKTFIPLRKHIKEDCIKSEKNIINNVEVNVIKDIDFNNEDAHCLGMKYFASRENIKEKLKENAKIFRAAEFPKNNMSRHFHIDNMELLNLCSPTFALTIASKLKSLNKLTTKYKNPKYDKDME